MWLTIQRIAFNIMLIGAMLGVSIATGEMVNESHVPVGKSGVMTSSARELKEVPNREIVQGRKLKEVPKWQMDSTEYLYFKDPVGDAGGRTGGRFTSLDKCTRYQPLFGPESKYDFTDPSCSWMQGDRVSKACQYYCYYTDKYGVSRINAPLWEAAQRGEAAVWRGWGGDADDRSGEALQGFENYEKVSLPLGRLLEIGSGPFTQTRVLIKTLRDQGKDPGVTSIDLADPGIHDYLSNPKCTYKNKRLMGYEVRTHAVGGEGLNFRRATFDTVVSINVLEHCQNAFEYMRKIHQVLKPGGQLIFHDRVYDGFWSVIDPVKDGPVEIAGLHPLRVKMRLIDIFMQGRYTASLFSRKLTREMEDRSKTQIKEDPVWIIAHKNHNATAQSSIQQGS